MDDRLWVAPDDTLSHQIEQGYRPDRQVSNVSRRRAVWVRPLSIALIGMALLLLAALALSQPIRAENTPPSASIEHISPEKPYTTETVSFFGRGEDPDGNVTAWSWHSDRDGYLSETTHFDLSGLSVGSHNITFRVRDDAGAWSDKATREISVLDNDLPHSFQGDLSQTSLYREEELTVSTVGEDEETNLSDMTPQLEYRFPQSVYGAWSVHTGDVFSTDISRDGERFVIGSLDRRIICFSRDSETPLWSYPVGAWPEVAISGDGQYIAGKSWDRRVHLFHYRNPTPLWSYDTGEILYAVDISDNSQYLAAASANGKVFFFHRGSSTPLWNYTTGGEVDRIALSADGQYLAVASSDRRVYLFHKDSSEPLWNYTTEGRVYAVAISANGEYIVAGSRDQRVYLFNRDRNEPLWHHATQGYVDSVAISNDGLFIAAGSDDKKVYYFRRDVDDPLWSYQTRGPVKGVSLSRDGTLIAAGSRDNSVYLFHSESDQPFWTQASGGDVNKVRMSHSGEDVVAGSNDGRTYFISRWSDRDLVNTSFSDGRWDLKLVFSSSVRPGAYDYRLRFMDGQGGLGAWTGLNQTSIILNRHPVAHIQSIDPSPAFSTQLVTFVGMGNDTDGEYLISGYHWESDLQGYLDGNASFALRGLIPGEHTLTFRVMDGDGDWSENATATLSLQENQPPFIQSLKVPSPQVPRGSQLHLLVNASDDHDQESELSFQVEYLAQDWDPLDLRDSYYANGQWRFVVDFALGHPLGPFQVRFRAVDGHEGYGQWTIPETGISVINNRPVAFIDSIVPYRSNFTELVTFTGHGEDLDGTITGYRWHSATDGILSDLASFSTSALTPGVHTIHLFVLDSDGEWSPDANVTFRVNAPPTAHIASIDPIRLTLGTPVNLSGYGEDADGVIVGYRWRASWTPANLSLEPSFLLTEIPYGIHTLYFSVQDNRGIWSLETKTSLHVNARPSARILDTTPTLVHSGQMVGLASTAVDLDGYIVEERWVSSLNGVLDLNGGTAIDYLQPGQHILSLQVKDDFGAWSYPVEWSLRVNDRPRVDDCSLVPQVVENGKEVVISINATDPDGQVDLYRLGFEPHNQGPIRYFEFSPVERWTLDTSSFEQGNHSVFLTIRDSQGGWSIPHPTWVYINDLPVALTGSLEVSSPGGGLDVVTLSAGGLDDEALVAYQWRSDLDGFLGQTSEPRIELVNLTPARHRLSVRVQDVHGFWSAWAAWEEPVTISAPEEPEPELFRLVRAWAPMGALALVGLLAMAGVGIHRRRNRIYRTQVVEPLARLRQLAQTHEEAGLAYPQERFDHVVRELSRGRYREVLADSVSLAKQMSETLELYGTARQMLDSTHQLNQLVALTDEAATEPDLGLDLEDQMTEALEQYDEARELLRKARELTASAQLDVDDVMDWEERNN